MAEVWMTSARGLGALTSMWYSRQAADSARPAWSVRVNPGADAAGTGLRLIRSARDVEMLAGIPLGRSSWPVPGPDGRATAYADTPDAAAVTNASRPSISRRPGHLRRP